MIKYHTFNEIKEMTNFPIAHKTLQNIWYGYAEGFYHFTGEYQQYLMITNILNGQLPFGWNLIFDENESITITHHLDFLNITLHITKQKSGYEKVWIESLYSRNNFQIF